MVRTAERRRSLQDERCEDTRARLLEATLESLVAVGYARTSTTEIAERAGVSRGAQVYHYPAKAALVVAAVDYLLQRRYQELQQLFAKHLPRAGGPGAAIDLLWRMFEGPTFAAWLEFVVASRTDPELRAAVVRQSEPFVNSVGEALRKYLPEAAWNPVLRKPDLVFAVLDGLALARSLYADEERSTRMLASFRELVERMQPRRPAGARKTKRIRRGP